MHLLSPLCSRALISSLRSFLFFLLLVVLL